VSSLVVIFQTVSVSDKQNRYNSRHNGMIMARQILESKNVTDKKPIEDAVSEFAD
jgi:hypothetical protein